MHNTTLDQCQKGHPQKKNILRLTRTGFAFKYLNRNPIGMLAWSTPDEIFFNAEQRETIIAHGYKNEIEKWEQGKLGELTISINGRQDNEDW